MRGFSDEERKEIREEFIKIGKVLIIHQGYRKTNIKDITDRVGVAEGNFYRFFNSKAELYMEILYQESEELIDTIEIELEGVDSPEKELELLFITWAKEIEERPIMVIIQQESPDHLLCSVNNEMIEKIKDMYADRLLPIITDLQARSDGLIGHLDSYLVIELLSVVADKAAQHEEFEEYGWSDYPQFRNTLATILARGLISSMSDSE